MLLAAVLSAGLMPAPRAAAAEGTRIEGSVNFVPDDAAFYGAMLRNREQVDAVVHSKAWAKIQALPAVQTLWQKAHEELKKPGGPMAQFMQFYKQPENQELVALLADMGSQEVFFYGDQSWVGFLELATKINQGMQFGPLAMMASGGAAPGNMSKLQGQAVIKVLMENANLLRVPNLMIGFKITKADRAEAQLKRLEQLLKAVASHQPELKGRVKNTKVGEQTFLTLNLDGGMVPWDQIHLDQVEQEAGQADELVKQLKQQKLVVAVGIREGYLLLSVGDSTAPIAKLGQAKALAARPELKPLAQFVNQRITGIDYISKALLARIGMSKKDIDGLAKLGKQYLKKADLPADKRAQVDKDVDELARDIKMMIPELGAQVGFSFLTDRGQESYSYNYSQHLGTDGSQVLSLLNHVGGKPLLAIVGRSTYRPENYQLLVKWVKKANAYAEDFVVANLQADQKDQYDQFAKIVHPIVQRLDETTSKLLLPAFKDGQSAFVLDAKIKSKQWVQPLPTDKAMPMIEPAIVCGVSDEDSLKKAFAEYRDTINDAISKVRELVPILPAELEIPAPETKKLEGGTMYYYPLPPIVSAMIDEQLLPNAGLSKHVLVLSIAPKHTERLLLRQPLKVDGGPLADYKTRPLAAAIYFDWAGMVDAVTPWNEFGVEKHGDQLLEGLEEATGKEKGAKGVEGILSQVRTVLEVLKVLRGSTSATYFEGTVLVTHTETVFHDVK
jgi:hypothetical protein